jgi:hypothetical protein
MSNYGRNFEFRVPPIGQHRNSRYYLAGATARPIGAPVVVNPATAEDVGGRLALELETGATARPAPGLGGIIVFEHASNAFDGYDPQVTLYSDLGDVPAGKAAQLVHGTEVKVVFRNTSDRTYVGLRDYEGRVMVAGLGATPTLAVGNYLTPGTGDDTSGYWAETADVANAWLVVTKVDAARGEVEAQMLF